MFYYKTKYGIESRDIASFDDSMQEISEEEYNEELERIEDEIRLSEESE